MSEWVFFMHPPRDDFMATMTNAEPSAFEAHAAWLRELLPDGSLIVAGPAQAMTFETAEAAAACYRAVPHSRHCAAAQAEIMTSLLRRRP